MLLLYRYSVTVHYLKNILCVGEFTKRAFYAGKFDLTEVEGLSDLIDAETEIQRKQALYQMGGSLRELYLNWRKIISEVIFTYSFY